MPVLVTEPCETIEVLTVDRRNAHAVVEDPGHGGERVLLLRGFVFRNLEATPRIELGMEVLQTSALPLGYVAVPRRRFYRRPPPPSLAVRLLAHLAEHDFRDVMARVPAGG